MEKTPLSLGRFHRGCESEVVLQSWRLECHMPPRHYCPFLLNSFDLLPTPLPHLAPCFCLGSIFFEMTLTRHHSVPMPQGTGLSTGCRRAPLCISAESVKRHPAQVCWACSGISSAWMAAGCSYLCRQIETALPATCRKWCF